MTIDELGSLGEFIGSIIVLISLVYLALEIRSNTETARTSTYQAVVSEFGALNRSMASTPGLSRLFASALEDFDSLDSEEKRVFRSCSSSASIILKICTINIKRAIWKTRCGPVGNA